MSYKGVSLFSGCGGLDLGFESCSGLLKDQPNDDFFEIVWANDIDEQAVETYSNNFDFIKYSDPDKICSDDKYVYSGDVKEICFEQAVGNKDIDFVLGGFPCQDFSILRGDEKRKGIKVKRGELYLQFVRALVTLQPKFFVAENVKGLKSANNGAAFKKIKDDFQHLQENWPEICENLDVDFELEIPDGKIKNYNIVFDKIVNFADFGVPQNRERLIMIGIRKDKFSKDTVNAKKLKKQISNNIRSFNVLPVTPLEIFEGNELSNLRGKYSDIMKKFEEYINKMETEIAEKYKEEIWDNYTLNIKKDYFKLNNLENIRSFRRKGAREVLEELGAVNKPVENISYEDDSNVQVNCQKRIVERMRRIPPGENHEFVKGTEYSVKGLMSNIYRRVHPLVPSPTIIANGGGGTYGYHYKRERQNLTNRERARLQTFPDNFLFEGSKSDIRRQIGNSVPPFGAKKIAVLLKNIMINLEDKKGENRNKNELIASHG